MSNPLERSILMVLGAAAISKEMADSIAGSLAQKGEETTALGREAVDEAVQKAKEETRSLRGRFDDTLRRNFRELGLAQNEDVDELKLKVAQLEHRISLLEAESERAAEARETAAGEGVIGEAAFREPEKPAEAAEKPSQASKKPAQATKKE